MLCEEDEDEQEVLEPLSTSPPPTTKPKAATRKRRTTSKKILNRPDLFNDKKMVVAVKGFITSSAAATGMAAATAEATASGADGNDGGGNTLRREAVLPQSSVPLVPAPLAKRLAQAAHNSANSLAVLTLMGMNPEDKDEDFKGDVMGLDDDTMFVPGIALGADTTSATLAVGPASRAMRNRNVLTDILGSLQRAIGTLRRRDIGPTEAVSPATALERSAKIGIPCRGFDEDTACMSTPVTFVLGTGGEVTIPECSWGQFCVTMSGKITGMPAHKAVPLQVYMSESELEIAATTGVLPTDARERPCVLCLRQTQAIIAIMLRMNWTTSVNVASREAVVCIAQVSTSAVGPGQYRQEMCLMPCMFPCLSGPSVIPNTSKLRAVHRPSPFPNAKEKAYTFVNQDDLQDRTGMPPVASFDAPGGGGKGPKRRRKGGDDDDHDDKGGQRPSGKSKTGAGAGAGAGPEIGAVDKVPIMDPVVHPAPSLFAGPGVAKGFHEMDLKTAVDRLWAGVGDHVSPPVVPTELGKMPIVGSPEPVYTETTSVEGESRFRTLLDVTSPPINQVPGIAKVALRSAGIVPSSVQPPVATDKNGWPMRKKKTETVGVGRRRRIVPTPPNIPAGTAMGINVVVGPSDF